MDDERKEKNGTTSQNHTVRIGWGPKEHPPSLIFSQHNKKRNELFQTVSIYYLKDERNKFHEKEIRNLFFYFVFQVFLQPAHIFQPGVYPEGWLTFGEDNSNIPIAVQVCSFRLGQVRSGQIRLGQVRLGVVRLGVVRLGVVRLGQVRLGQVRLSGQGRLG